MPAAIPAVRGAQVVRALERAGFEVARISGSHHVMNTMMAGQFRCQSTTRDIAKGTLRNILAIIGMTADELRDLL